MPPPDDLTGRCNQGQSTFLVDFGHRFLRGRKSEAQLNLSLNLELLNRLDPLPHSILLKGDTAYDAEPANSRA